FLIFLYVSYELSFDEHIDEGENVYRLAADFTLDGHKDVYSNVPRPLGAALVSEYPGITSSVRLFGYSGLQVHEGVIWNKNEDYITAKNAFVVDSSFFQVFRLPLISGDSATALNEPNSIVISETVSRNLFGDQPALGKRVKLQEENEAVVTGVFKDIDKPTYIPFDVLISYNTYFDYNYAEDIWYGAHIYSYVRTTSSFKPADVNDHWQPFYEKYMKETFDILNGEAEIIFQPLTSLHLAPELIWEPYDHGSEQNVYVFVIVGVFLLIVACFNYTNLALSKSLSRAKEVGVRKALGASRQSLSIQFISESIVTALIAAVISISFIIAILPTFNQLVGQELTINFIENPMSLFIIISIGIVVGIISGVYPAFHISSLEAASILKGSTTDKNGSNLTVRKGLVMFQQAISLSLIICTLVVIDQVTFVRQRDIGFDKDNLVLIHLKDEAIRSKIKTFQQEVSEIPEVQNVTRMNDTPMSGLNEFSYQVEQSNGEFQSIPTQLLEVSDNYLETMDIKLLAGRTFIEADTNYRSVLINEYQAAYLGYTPEDVVGARFKFPEDTEERTIIGVVNNFSMGSATDPLKSLTMSYHNGGRRYMGIRVQAENQAEAIEKIETLWKSYGPAYPFEYTFMDDELDSLLGKEDRLYNLLVFGSILIIFVSCLGLFGLVSYTALQKTKEIGIRKVLGANSFTLFYTLIQDFIKLLFFAFVIAAIVSWYFGKTWLDNFTFRTDFDWSNVIIAALATILITLFTLSYHAQKVISANPVDSLKEQ
ncbi:ABC transporter permease, partial [Fulvivirga lutimaris]|uniref:ABC transporter permease n=1 Tax=Fulvivirga lutimaris TaxID=1819566 RepID=UPI0012BCF286